MKRAAAAALLVLALAGCSSPEDALDNCIESVLEAGESRGVVASPEVIQRVTATCEREQQQDPDGFQETWG